MNIGVVLVVEHGGTLALDEVRTLLSARIPLVPRLRQRLRSTPIGCGRSIWVDSEDFDADRHLGHVVLAPHLGSPDGAATGSATVDPTLLAEAAAFVCTPLPRDRPLWAARWVTRPGDDDAALVLSAHHCLADGLGGLAVLAALCDECSPAPAGPGRASGPPPFPRPAPTTAELARDAWRARAAAVKRAPARLGEAATGIRELAGPGRHPRLAARTSLNRPTGPGRRMTTAAVSVDGLVECAHARGCTVNDLVLSSVAGAVGGLLRSRGESVSELVASVPVSDRRSTVADRLGNHTGVMSLTLPLVDDADERLRRVAALTMQRKGPVRGASSGPLGLAFRMLARVGAFQTFVDHQRLVHTFVTNVRGPTAPWHLAGRRVSGVVPMAITPGNVGVSFDVLSYAGRLVVTLVADPAVVPDQDDLTARLEVELCRLAARPAADALGQ
ncbi:WS/DGAT domain-containing protein [Terrabacter sp. LjRoot27]